MIIKYLEAVNEEQLHQKLKTKDKSKLLEAFKGFGIAGKKRVLKPAAGNTRNFVLIFAVHRCGFLLLCSNRYIFKCQ